jgi:hypothetical protein
VQQWDDQRDDSDDDSGDWPEFDVERGDADGDSSSESSDEAFSLPTHVFFENEDLIRALNDPRRGENDPDLAKRLFSALLRATLIALVPEEQELDGSEADSGEVMLEGELELSFVLVRHPDVEGDIVPMFTDEGSLGTFMPDGGRYVALSVRDLFPLLGSGDGPPNIVINPGGDEALLLTPRMVQDLIDSSRGYGTQVIDEGVDVIVAAAEDPLPETAQQTLADLLTAHDAVLRCTQLQWFMPDRHTEPSLVLAVELDPDVTGDDRRLALASLWRDLSPILRTLDRHVEMVDLAGQRERLEPMVRELPSFYERSAR